MRRLIVVLIIAAAIGRLVICGSLYPVPVTRGAGATWNKTPLDAGRVRAILVHPLDSATVFAGTDKGLFRSTDHGTTWNSYGTGIKTSSSTTVRVLSLAVANDGTPFYAGTSAGVFQSTDGGVTWTQGSGMLSGNGILRYYYAVGALAVDPSDPDTVYAGDSGMMTEGRVLKSTDGGATWSSSGSGIVHDDVDALAVVPDNTSTIYAVADGILYGSTDAGSTWVKTTGTMLVGSSSADVLTVVATTDAIYTGTTAGVWKSTDRGATWSQGSGLGSTGVLRYFYAIAALAVDPANASVLYAGDSGLMTSGGVSLSSDSGIHWSQVGGAFSENVSSLAVDRSDPRVLYAATDTGLFRLMGAASGSFHVAASVSGGHGSVTPASQDASQGQSLTVSVMPDAGYRLSLLTDNGASVTGLVRDNAYVLSGITADHVIVAVFESIPIILPPLSSHTLVLTIGSPAMSIDGTPATLDSPPIIREGRTLLPIRAMIEALEGSVAWDAVAHKATVMLGAHTVEIWIGSRQARVDGAYVTLDVAAMIVNSRTLLPLRFVAENLGCTVTWDPIARTVTITL
jgi:photosystem II stability/assembly factor-like uncharacterized protein